jgi:hypothetical protein
MIRLTGLVDFSKYKTLHEEMPDINNEQEQGEYDDHEGEMARAQLMSIHKQAGELFNMIADGEELEGWVQHKLSLAADYISAVYNNLQYEKSNASTLGSGMGAPADVPLANNSEIK